FHFCRLPILSFIRLIKDISPLLEPDFVLHLAYQGHFTSADTYFCPSSSLSGTFHFCRHLILSFIRLIKDISLRPVPDFVLHPAYQGHFATPGT
ncbi:hypothetical protein, partial [Neobacillus citreus]